MEQNVIYTFGQFRLQTDTHLLCYESTTIRLQPKIYQLLLYFLQHTGRLIPKTELFNEVWQGRIVEDSALRLAVNTLRKALQDETKTPRYISTTCKCGYRFLPDVRIETDSQSNADSLQTYGLPYKPNRNFHVAVEPYNFELKQLLEAFSETSSGKRNLIFLNGLQGLGKTALLERFLASIEKTEFGLLRARCVPLESAVEPFLPLLEALERRCQESYGKLLIECLQQLAPTWLYQMLNMLNSEAIAELEPKVSHITTGRMLREGADFFEMLACQSTFILVLDNCHWSDEFTLDLVNFLAFRCSPTKLLIILSYRPDIRNNSSKRIESMRLELRKRGLCHEVALNNNKLGSGLPLSCPE